MNDLSLFNSNQSKEVTNFVTVRQFAAVYGVSYDTVNNAVKRLFPEIVKNGKTTYLNEMQVAAISKELKSNAKVTEQLTFEAGSKVKNTTTELELQQNFYAASQAYAKFLEAERARLQVENERQKQQLTEQAPKVATYNRIANATGLKSMQEVAKILHIGSKTLFAILRDKKIFYREKSNGVNIPVEKYIKQGLFEVKEEPYRKDGKDCVYTRIFATAKGLLWLEKIIQDLEVSND